MDITVKRFTSVNKKDSLQEALSILYKNRNRETTGVIHTSVGSFIIEVKPYSSYRVTYLFDDKESEDQEQIFNEIKKFLEAKKFTEGDNTTGQDDLALVSTEVNKLIERLTESDKEKIKELFSKPTRDVYNATINALMSDNYSKLGNVEKFLLDLDSYRSNVGLELDKVQEVVLSSIEQQFD